MKQEYAVKIENIGWVTVADSFDPHIGSEPWILTNIPDACELSNRIWDRYKALGVDHLISFPVIVCRNVLTNRTNWHDYVGNSSEE